MKTFRTKNGPFRQRQYFSPEEIESICVDELSKVGLYPSEPGPIRIERYVEKRFSISPTYDILPDGVLGYTRFGRNGVESIVISKALEDEQSEVAEKRVRTTIGHEAGHGLLHAHLFALDEHPTFADLSDAGRPKVLCRDSAAATYNGQWWEYQANQIMGAILIPQALLATAVDPFMVPEGLLGMKGIPETQRENVARQIASIFDVNPVVARIRLAQLYPAKNGQLVL